MYRFRTMASVALVMILFIVAFATQVLASDKYYICCQQIPPPYPEQGWLVCTQCRQGIGCTLYYYPQYNAFQVHCNDALP